MEGINIDAASIAASVAIAINETETRSIFKVLSVNADTVDLTADQQSVNNARLQTYGGSLADITTNVAVGYGRSKSIIEAELKKASQAKNGFNVKNSAKDILNADITSQTIQGFSLTAMVGAAYAKDDFSTTVNLPMSDNGTLDVSGGDFAVQTNYTITAKADVTPASGGVSAQFAGLKANVSVAKSTAEVMTTVGGKGTVAAKKSSVITNGTSTTDAVVNTPSLSVNAVNIIANVAVSKQQTKQTAMVAGDPLLAFRLDGDFTVKSQMNDNSNNHATASVGGTGYRKGMKIDGLSVKADVASAEAGASSTAKAQKIQISNINTAITVSSEGSSNANAKVGQDGEVTVLGIGLNGAYADAKGSFIAQLTEPDFSAAKAVNILSRYSANATAKGAVSNEGVSKVSAASIQQNEATANVATEADASLKGGNYRNISQEISVKATGNSAGANATIDSAKVDVSAISLTSNRVTARMNAKQTAQASDMTVGEISNKMITVESVLVKAETKATVGATDNSKKVSLISSNPNSASADNNATVTAKLSNLKLNNAADVNVKAELKKNNAQADVANGLNASLVNVSVIHTDANAGGNITAELNTNGGTLKARVMNVETVYTTKAKADVAATGTTISGYNQKNHKATSNTKIKAAAKLINTGADISADSLKVSTTGTVDSIAYAKTPEWTISAGSVESNKADACANAAQSTIVETNKPIRISGDIDLISEISRSAANATVGSPANSKNVSVVDKNTNFAAATERLSSKVSVLGTGRDAKLIAGGSIRIHSGTAKNSMIKTRQFSTAQTSASSKATSDYGLSSNGKLDARAYTEDLFSLEMTKVFLQSMKGNIDLNAVADVTALGIGSAPGSLTAKKESKSYVASGIGWTDSDERRQRVEIILDSVQADAAGMLSILADNNGKATSSMNSKTDFTLGTIADSKIPTDSYYGTKIEVKGTSALKSAGDLMIQSTDENNANSSVKADTLGLFLSVDKMQGLNEVDTVNKIIFGNGTKLESTGGNLFVTAESNAVMEARTEYGGKFSIYSGSEGDAHNRLDRIVTVEAGDDIDFRANGVIRLWATAGASDNIDTVADTQNTGLYADPETYANTYLYSTTTTKIGQGGLISAGGDVRLYSEAKMDIYTFGFNGADGGLEDVYVRAYTRAVNSAYVKLNEQGKNGRQLSITSRNGEVRVRASGWHTEIYNYAWSRARAGGAYSDATSKVSAEILHQVFLDNTAIKAKQQIVIESLNTGAGNNNHSYLKAKSYSVMWGAAGRVKPISEFYGSIKNEIRSSQTNGGYKVILEAPVLDYFIQSGSKKIDISKPRSWDKSGITVTKGYADNYMSYGSRNDLLGYKPPAKNTTNFSSGTLMTTAALSDTVKQAGDTLQKTLGSVYGSGAVSIAMTGIWKARYNEEENLQAQDLFVTDVYTILKADAEPTDLKRYRLWNNTVTLLNTFLLPNAARMNTTAGGALRYVTELMGGDVLGDGTGRILHITTALTQRAWNEPVVEINRTTVLDFRTGMLRIEQQDDLELNVSDISGQWLADQFRNGNFQIISADSNEILNHQADDDLPTGEILKGITGGESDGKGRLIHWLGRVPEDAKDNEPLYMLRLDPETDEAELLLTSAEAIRNGDEPKILSMLIYRDSQSDRKDEIRYNVMLYKSTDPEHGTCEIITDVLMGRELNLPASMNVMLRALRVKGADSAAYGITEHVFAADNGTDGTVNILDGAYTATFDGSVFESDFTRIEGCDTGAVKVTVKKEQPIWPEWDTETTAHDIGGLRLLLTEDGWRLAEEDTEEKTAEEQVAGNR